MPGPTPPRRTLRRGPRNVLETSMPEEQGRGVLAPELQGTVVRVARNAVGLSVRELARMLDLPPTTISNLEKGIVAMGVYHLDVIAAKLSMADARLRGDHAHIWEGWELHLIASRIADQIQGNEDKIVLWISPRRVEHPERYTRGRALLGLVKVYWPYEYRDRL